MVEWIKNLFPLIALGGWMMWPIVGCSLVALAIILERTWTLLVRSSRIVPARLLREVELLLDHGRIEDAVVACRKDGSMMSRVALAGLRQFGSPRSTIRESIEDAGRREANELEHYLQMLGAIAVVSPLLGLLGTVVGMIQIFMQLSAAHIGQYEALAGGIYVALFTTAGGLFVAVPAYLMHQFFVGLVDHRVQEMEDYGVDLLNRLERATVLDAGSGDADDGAEAPKRGRAATAEA